LSSEYSEAALARRAEKQALVLSFPGRLADPKAAGGKTVACVETVDETTLILFADQTFLLVGPAATRADTLLQQILSLEHPLAQAQPEGWAELHRRIRAEEEAMRLARMEKVLGAVETNLPQIPELRSELLRLLEALPQDDHPRDRDSRDTG